MVNGQAISSQSSSDLSSAIKQAAHDRRDLMFSSPLMPKRRIRM
jgi:biopolymer transport protein ExbD